MEATSEEKDLYINQFFDWVGDAGCIFPFKGVSDKLKIVDIESMKVALDHLLYDKDSKSYGVQVNESAQENGFMHDPMEILPHPSDGFVVYEYRDDEDSTPEPSYSITLKMFVEKYPHAIILI